MKEENILLFDRYSDGLLSEPELIQFESRLASDDVFKQEFDTFNTLMQTIHIAKSHQLRVQLGAVRSELNSEKKKATNVITMNRPMRYAAAAIVVIALGIFLWTRMNSSVNHLELYAEYHTTYPSPTTTRSGEQADKKWQAFAENYAAAEYESALQQVATTDSIDRKPEYIFYQALCHMELANGSKELVRKNFTTLAEGNYAYSDASMWYLSLFLLREGEIENAKIWLNKIKLSGNYKKKEASELLEALPK